MRINPVFQTLMSRYDEHHQNPTNVRIHWVAVPAIYWSVLGLFWCLFESLSSPINMAWLLMVAVMVYYFKLSLAHALAMTVISIAMLLSIEWLAHEDISVLQTSIMVFVVMWVLQFWGHKIEGKSPSFLEDLRFLLIGPLWWSNHFVKRLI